MVDIPKFEPIIVTEETDTSCNEVYIIFFIK